MTFFTPLPLVVGVSRMQQGMPLLSPQACRQNRVAQLEHVLRGPLVSMGPFIQRAGR